MTDFLLLHGASHTAWCWHLTIDELERRGHRGLAVDLPIGDPEAGAEHYAQVAAEAARARFDGPVVVVGHSLAGIVIPLLPEQLEVEELVFLCSVLPIPGLSMIDQWEKEPDMLLVGEQAPPEPGTLGETSAEDLLERSGFNLTGATATFFHDAPPELAQLAYDHLRRQEMTSMTEPSPVSVWPPTVPCRYVLARDDRAISAAWARREVPRRLGVVPIEIDGSHSPFLTRPAELVDVLLARRASVAPTG